MVFFSMLLAVFNLFCFNCKATKPAVSVQKQGTMAIVTQTCSVCKKTWKWYSQPMIMGKIPAGNLLTSFGILMSGISISKTMLMFKHIGLCMITPRTYFRHQSKFLFPAVLQHWKGYRQNLIEKVKGISDPVWSGDGRFDSMGHNAKYGVYTMFSNNISKLVHFELRQVIFNLTKVIV